MYSNKDIAEYYDTTQVHYERWWDLKNTYTLHYGICDDKVRNFKKSLVNTNKILQEISNISANDMVLDAGCGVGGSAIFLTKNTNAHITGISLSKKQIDFANKLALKLNLSDRLSFFEMDYSNTPFHDQSFDVVWACESICHASDKDAFLKECYRILKNGGRLILSDYFLTNEDKNGKYFLIDKWMKTWSISNFSTHDKFIKSINHQGFSTYKSFDFTENIKKCSRRYFFYSIMGAIPSELYNLFHPEVSRFAKTHYKSGFFQYRALRNMLWRYYVILAVK